MRNRMWICFAAFMAALCWGAVTPVFGADVDWTEKTELNLEASPLDVAASADGEWLFVLTPGQVLVYAAPENKLLKKISVHGQFDRLAYSPKDNTLVLSSSQGAGKRGGDCGSFRGLPVTVLCPARAGTPAGAGEIPSGRKAGSQEFPAPQSQVRGERSRGGPCGPPAGKVLGLPPQAFRKLQANKCCHLYSACNRSGARPGTL